MEESLLKSQLTALYSGFVFHLAVLPWEISRAVGIISFFSADVCALISLWSDVLAGFDSKGAAVPVKNFFD